MVSKNAITILLTIILSGILFSGCTGQEGPAGQDAVGVDTTPPVIILVSPTPNDTLNDTLIAVANAVDVGGGIGRVEFYIDGSNRINDTTIASVTTEPYRYEFLLRQMNLALGQHTLAARAYDVEANSSLTPTLIFYYSGPRTSGVVKLFNYNEANSAQHILWPLFEHRSDSIEADTSVALKVAIRFAPAAACSLQYVVAYLDTISADSVNLSENVSFSIYSSDGAFPVDSLSTVIDTIDLLDFGDNREIHFPDTLTFRAGEEFHLVIEVADIDEYTNVAFWTEENLPYQGPPYRLPLHNFSAIWDAEENRWKSFQEMYGEDYGTYEFWASAVVEYR